MNDVCASNACGHLGLHLGFFSRMGLYVYSESQALYTSLTHTNLILVSKSKVVC